MNEGTGVIAVCNNAWLREIYGSLRSIPSETQSSKVMRHLDKHTQSEKGMLTAVMKVDLEGDLMHRRKGRNIGSFRKALHYGFLWRQKGEGRICMMLKS